MLFALYRLGYKGKMTGHGFRAVASTCLNEMGFRPDVIERQLAGYKFHGMTGNRKGTYALSVSGNWRITFRFEAGNAVDVNLEDYH